MIKNFIAGLFIICTITSIGQIATSTLTAAQYVQNILLGPGVTASNITYTGYFAGIASFTASPSTNLGITKGVYLTSGSNGTVFGENGPTGPSSFTQSISQGQNGDPDLDALAGVGTHDASILEFDFIPLSDSIKFRYVFASEEYNEFVGSPFNDPFSFILSGVTTPLPPTNIALIPNTNVPITINSVNNGNSWGSSFGPCTNCTYYRDNIGGYVHTIYDGLTTVLIAKQKVICGEKYHIKLAVGDASDDIIDSGVFLEAGSFSSIPLVVNSASVCSGNSIALTASGATNYSWSPSTGLSTINGSSTIASPSATTIYTITFVNANGACSFSGTSTATVTVKSNPTIAVNSFPLCGGSSIILKATGAASYNWSPPVGLNSASGSSVTASPTDPTIYTITGTDANGCKDTASIMVKVNPLPPPTKVNILSSLNKGCAELCNTFSVQSTPPANTVNWTLGNGTSSDNLNSAFSCYSAPGIYTISVNVMDVNNCMGRATYTIEVYPKPIADFNFKPAKPLESVDSVEFSDASSSANIIRRDWYFTKDSQYSYNSQHPTFMYNKAGEYPVALVVISDHGCADTLVKKIQVFEDFGIYVPDTFTPNGDGLNDIFQPKGSGIDNYLLTIFDRWGGKIFESDTFEKGWDGTYQGKGNDVCQDDIYVWKIKVISVFGKNKELIGHVTLEK